MLGRKNQPKKYYGTKSCGECRFRQFGTDSHYVCKEGDSSNWFRVRKDGLACPKFRKIAT